MIILEFKTDNLVKEAVLLGEYIASKYADSAEGFFRLAPCCTDKRIIKRILVGAAARIALTVGINRCRFSLSGPTLTFNLKTAASRSPQHCLVSSSDTFPDDETLKSILQSLLLRLILLRWFEISGLQSSSSNLSSEIDALFNSLQEAASSKASPLRPRRIPPI